MIELFQDCLFRTCGIHHCLLIYVVREDDAVPNEADDPLVDGYSYGASGYVLYETIARLDYTDTLYKYDNTMVYAILEEATCGSIYDTEINPYAKRKDGRSAWAYMVSSHDGQEKWKKIQKTKRKLLMNNKWNGHNSSLEKFMGIHCSSFVQL